MHFPMLLAFFLFAAERVFSAQPNAISSTTYTPAHYLILNIAVALLLLAIIGLLLQIRKNGKQTKEIAAKLNQLQQHAAETSHELDHEKQKNKRNQNIIQNASVGMFRLNRDGECTYLNSAFENMSGLYLKKINQEGIASAVHPEDRPLFEESWEAFTSAKNDKPFVLDFRLQFRRGRETRFLNISCRAHKVFNQAKEVEGYIGWVTDISTQMKNLQEINSQIENYQFFMKETTDGYYRLKPDTPILLQKDPERLAKQIAKRMHIQECNEAFSAIHGVTTEALIGRGILELNSGCGPFRNQQDLLYFVEDNFKSLNSESAHQNSRGHRINLLHNVVGIVDDGKLIEIHGTFRDITMSKREKAELTAQIRFMNRVIDTLPADIHVKDTRCRYLYASKKLAERTGIKQDEWIGKTIFEMIPGTGRNHEQKAIDAMKSGKSVRGEYRYEVGEKSGWVETVQVPLVSDAGLVEGIVGLSIDISERKKNEKLLLEQNHELESMLTNSREEHNKTTLTLSETLRNLNQVETDKATIEQNLRGQLEQEKQKEEILRQRQSDQDKYCSKLVDHLEELKEKINDESRKRTESELKLAVRNEEFAKTEAQCTAKDEQLKQLQSLLNKEREHEKKQQEEQFIKLRQKEQDQKETQHKLEQAKEELTALRHRFSTEIQEETKQLKRELADRKIREKEILQHEKALENKITELQTELTHQEQEFEQQLEASKATLLSSTSPTKEKCTNLHDFINEIDKNYSPRAALKNIFFATSQSDKTFPTLTPSQTEQLKTLFSTLLDYALQKSDQGRIGLHASCEENESITFKLVYTHSTEDSHLRIALSNETEWNEHNELAPLRLCLNLLKGNSTLEQQNGTTTITLKIPFTS